MDNLDSNKKAMLASLIKHDGVVTAACKAAKIPRSTYYNWLNEDAEFKALVDDAQETAIDTVESELFKQIKNGNTATIIFFLKTRAKHRGYVERQEVTGKDGAPIETRAGIITVELSNRTNSPANGSSE